MYNEIWKILQSQESLQLGPTENKTLILHCMEGNHFSGFFLSFYLFLRERQMPKSQRERDRDNIPSSLRTVSTEPDAGLELMNQEIITWAETKSQMLNWLSHPGTPGL